MSDSKPASGPALEALTKILDDARCDLEELNESGDLESRLEASQFVDELETLIADCKASGRKPTWIECGLCKGRGEHSEYEERWNCPLCKGRGGNWI